jgi:pSer/pThr/pTyr-binding forkhead associated (FHA) protein
MDVFEKLNKTFAGWYESLFGDAESDIRPKDVLRKIIGAMEENRKEGLDSRIYVPNKYVLEISFENDQEREYLLAFLEKAELEAALRKYMTQNGYHIRGPLDFTIEEKTQAESEETSEKLRVSCRWDVRPMEDESQPDPRKYVVPGLAESAPKTTEVESSDEEEYTVAGTDIYDASTVAPPSLLVKHADGSTERFLLSKPMVLIGRSRRLNNDLVIENDGMVSKRHASISMAGGGFVIKDLGSTNGVWVNKQKVGSAELHDGDEVRLGSTLLTFEEHPIGIEAPVLPSPADAIRASLSIEGRSDEFRLPSEAVIGKSLTSDIRLDHSSVARRHARVFLLDGAYFLEDLGSGGSTYVNRLSVLNGRPVQLHPGDQISIGEVNLRFEMG